MSDVTENYVPLAMTANTWVAGKPTTPYKTLVDRLKREAGSSTVKKYGYTIRLVHPKFSVSEIDGTIYTPAGHPTVLVEDKRRIEGVKLHG